MATATKIKTCGDCQFFEEIDHGDFPGEMGACKRRAPNSVIMKRNEAGREMQWADWPVVYVNDWCGEFQS